MFAPASSNVHGEWSVIDEYALVRCLNPLHRGHRIVGTAGEPSPMVIETILGFAVDLVDDYENATSTSRALAREPLRRVEPIKKNAF